MRIEDLVTKIEDLSDEELLERLRTIRKQREVSPSVDKPKVRRGRALLQSLSPEERQALLDELGE